MTKAHPREPNLEPPQTKVGHEYVLQAKRKEREVGSPHTLSLSQAEVIEEPVEVMSIIMFTKFDGEADFLARNVYIHTWKPMKITPEISKPAKSPSKNEEKCQYATETSGCRITGQYEAIGPQCSTRRGRMAIE